jgi:hypothetical protein
MSSSPSIVVIALKKVKIPGFRKGVVKEGRFEIAKIIVEYLKALGIFKSTFAIKTATARSPRYVASEAERAFRGPVQRRKFRRSAA